MYLKEMLSPTPFDHFTFLGAAAGGYATFEYANSVIGIVIGLSTVLLIWTNIYLKFKKK